MKKYYAHHGTAMAQWDYETNMTHMKRNITLDMRLKAACKPLTELDRVHVVKNLQMAGSAVDTEMLVNLALHEPRTFKVKWGSSNSGPNWYHLLRNKNRENFRL